MRWFFKSDFRSFYFLNGTQFLGALNDNIFKLLVIYLLINVQGPAAAPRILSLAGSIFVIPFLFFSSGAGVLADKHSKRTIIVFTKMLEVCIMIFGLCAVIMESEWGVYAALFCMATQSAIFGPSKYGIIPELVESKRVSKANGSLTSFTYLAIIFGTFLASFLTDVSNKNFILVGCFCVLISITGLLTSLGISRTEPQRSPKKINPLFLYEIYQTLKMSWKIPHLLPAIFGSAFFLFLGAFTQLNIIPFAMQSLHLSEVGGGYLFLATAVGIAIGALLAGQLSKDRVEPGISCISIFFVSILIIVLYLFSTHLWIVIMCLALLGVFGGAFLIPFDAFIQINSPDEKRGQVIAASNFFSFVGVLFAAFFLYALSEKLGLSSASGFALMGILSFIASVILSGRLSDLFFPFFARKILKRFRTYNCIGNLPEPESALLFQSNSWWDALLLFAVIPHLRILVPGSPFQRFPWFNGWIESIRIVSENSNMDKQYRTKVPMVYCFFIHQKHEKTTLHTCESYLKERHTKIWYAYRKKERVLKRFLFFRYHQKQIELRFTQTPANRL
jgi:acyl-[acyl-carrier-protein]-phospholipid O-acyltransferase/long-chain-fatty-acid--[acyl-carrier-protein] ligase